MTPRRWRSTLAAGLLAALGLAAAWPASARARPARHAAQVPQPPQEDAADDARARRLIGAKVENAQGERLGNIQDLVVDLNNNRVHYALLSFGGVLGLGDKLFAFPVNQFQPTGGHGKLVLNIDKARLKQAPGFDEQHAPDWNDRGYRERLHRFFGDTAALNALPGESLRRASELLGLDVADRDGKNLGEIDDLVVNLGSSRVAYAVLEFDRSWNLKDRLFALPLQAFQFPAERGKDAVLLIDKGQLDLSAGFSKDHWPRFDDPAYRPAMDRQLINAWPATGAGNP